MGGDMSSHAVDDGIGVGMLGGLHQPQMAFGQAEFLQPGDRAEDGYARLRHGRADQPFVTFAGKAVEDDPGDHDVGAQAAEALGNGGGGLALAGNVHD